jgi:hypothetical protein
MQFRKLFQFGVLLFLAAILASGCGTWSSIKTWAGYPSQEGDEEMVPPESQQETVMIDGKPYVRSKNPYWLTYPEQPEYIYVEKGRQFVSMQQYLINSLAESISAKQQKMAGKTIPPDQLQEMVRAEVNRILKQQGLGGFVSQTKGVGSMTMAGRAVAVIPDLDTPSSLRGLNRTLSMAMGEALGQTKDIKVSTPTQIDEALGKAGLSNKGNIKNNINALGDALGVQAIILTGLVPPQGGSQGAMVFQVYNGFTGLQEDALVAPAASAGITPDTVTKFAKNNTLRLSGDLARISWFGRVAFIKEGKVYLNLGQNSGLKVGDRLKVVEPGKEVINPTTHSVLGYTADIPQGEVKVTELLGNSAAVATTLSGGPFKANDKVKAVK